MSKATDELGKTKVKLQADVSLMTESIADHGRSAVDADNGAAKIAADAAAGDEKKLAAHIKLTGLAEVHRKQAHDLETVGLKAKREEIAEVDRQLTNAVFSDLAAVAMDVSGDISDVAKQLSDSLALIKPPVANLIHKINDSMTALESVLGKAPAQRLRDRALEGVTTGVRAELNKNLKAAGIHLFGALADSDFQTIVGPRLQDISNAISARMHSHAGASPVPGRKMYRAVTNITGLHGLNIKVGEILSLDPDDPSVRRMVELNALEQINEASGAA
jgi:hypothetical protein